MRRKRLELTNARGEKLAASLELPLHGRAESYALVAHCFTCSKDLNALRTIAGAMTHTGIGVIRFDFTGLGESGGEFADTTLSSNVDDLVEVTRQIEQDYGAVQLLVGHSFGGAAAILAADRLDGVRSVATIAAPADPVHVRQHLKEDIEDILEDGEAVVDIAGRPFKVRREFIKDLETRRLDEVLGGLGRPLLVLHSPRDQVVSIDHATRIFAASEHPRSFISLDEADHLLTNREDAEYVGHVIASWASRYVDTETARHWREDVDTARDVARTGEELLTELVASGFPLYADEPVEHGGEDAAPSPHDYLSAALASCTTMTLRMYADRKDWPLEAAVAHVDHEKVEPEDGDPYERFVCRVELEGELDSDQCLRLIEIANRCPVHRTLSGGAKVETKLMDDG